MIDRTQVPEQFKDAPDLIPRPMSVLQANDRRRWWVVGHLLGGSSADLARLSSVSRQSVHAAITKALRGDVYRVEPEVDLKTLTDYRAIFDLLNPKHRDLDVYDLAQLILSHHRGYVQLELIK